MALTVSEIGEFELIALLLEILGPQPTSVGLGTTVLAAAGDDCAAAATAPDLVSLQTTDTMVQGVHFLPDMPPELLGWKSLAANISDVAAMGGAPTLGLITLAIPPVLPLNWIRGWYRGLAECARQYRVAIAGGDIVRTLTEVCITVSLSGEVERSRIVTRSGSRPGDSIVVTGTPGDSAAGLALMLAGIQPPDRLRHAHLRPCPRVLSARAAVRSGGVRAMIDVSDGPGGDIRHLCAASGAGAVIEEALLPISTETRTAAARLGRDPLEFALSGGEDYELLLCADPDRVDAIVRAVESAGETSACVIGRMVGAEEGVTLMRSSGERVPLPGSFTHF